MSTVSSQSPVPSDAKPSAAANPPDALPHTSALASPRVASILGVVASVLVHAVIIGLGLLLIPTLRNAVTGPPALQEQTIVPIAELATDKVGGIPNPGMTSDRNRGAAQDADPNVKQSDAWANQKSKSLDSSLMNDAGDTTPVRLGLGSTKSGAGTGLGEGVAGGNLAKFGVPGGGSGIGPKGAVFGNGGNAYKIVFICDGTGTMLTKLPLLQRELRNTINKLKPKQSYNVVFFYDGENAAAVDKTKLLPAIPANNAKTFTFLDNFAVQGKTNPIPAIEMAFRMKPELVYFLSDGAFDDLAPYDEVVAKFAALNADKKTRVNTIIFTNTNEKTEDLQRAQATMKKIAADNGGDPRAIDPKQLLMQ